MKKREFSYFYQNSPMTKEALLSELRNSTFITLKPSPIHGIGVFALCPIPKGTKNIFSSGVGEWIQLEISEVEALPEHSKNLIETYCLFDNDHYYVPDYGFKVMDMVNYLNHSRTPNVISIEDGNNFEALRDIQAGEELLVDYSSLVEGMESYD